MENEMSDLEKEVADLKAKLAELEARLPKVEEPFKPSFEMPRFDPTENFRLPASAAKAMSDVINPKAPKFDPSAWARNSYPQPGGFGAPQDAKPKPVEPVRGSGWVEPSKLEGQIKGRWSK
jgi:hypothetical protein